MANSQVKPGVCDKSFGLHVAKIAHFPPEVISDAADRLRRYRYYCIGRFSLGLEMYPTILI